MKKRMNRINWSVFWPFLSFFLLFAVMCLCAIAPAVNKVVDKREVVVTVIDKGIKNYNKSSYYLIYCTDENQKTQVYQVSDSLFKMRFDSSDVYPNIVIGKTYKFTICGKRLPFLSWYPNIYQYEELE